MNEINGDVTKEAERSTERFWPRLRSRARRGWPQALVVLGGVILALTNLRTSDGGVPLLFWHPAAAAVFVVGAACFVVGSLFVYRARHREANLDAEVGALRIANGELQRRLGLWGEVTEQLFRAELELLAKELNYWSSERISLFVQDADHLVRVARVSANPTFRQGGRSAYPLHEGCLGEAFERGEAEDVELPDPRADLEAWKGVLWERWRIPPETANGLTMKSRTCIARRIDASPGKDAFGFIVFESESSASSIEQRYPKGAKRPNLDPEALGKKLKGPEGERLKCLLEAAAVKLGHDSSTSPKDHRSTAPWV